MSTQNNAKPTNIAINTDQPNNSMSSSSTAEETLLSPVPVDPKDPLGLLNDLNLATKAANQPEHSGKINTDLLPIDSSYSFGSNVNTDVVPMEVDNAIFGMTPNTIEKILGEGNDVQTTPNQQNLSSPIAYTSPMSRPYDPNSKTPSPSEQQKTTPSPKKTVPPKKKNKQAPTRELITQSNLEKALSEGVMNVFAGQKIDLQVFAKNQETMDRHAGDLMKSLASQLKDHTRELLELNTQLKTIREDIQKKVEEVNTTEVNIESLLAGLPSKHDMDRYDTQQKYVYTKCQQLESDMKEVKQDLSAIKQMLLNLTPNQPSQNQNQNHSHDMATGNNPSTSCSSFDEYQSKYPGGMRFGSQHNTGFNPPVFATPQLPRRSPVRRADTGQTRRNPSRSQSRQRSRTHSRHSTSSRGSQGSKKRGNTSTNNDQSSPHSKKPKKSGKHCFACGKIGHYASECTNTTLEQKIAAAIKKKRCTWCGTHGKDLEKGDEGCREYGKECPRCKSTKHGISFCDAPPPPPPQA